MLLKWTLRVRVAILPICTLLAPVGLGAQHADVPRTRTLPGAASSAFPYAQPQEVGLSSGKLEWLADEITEWVANGDLVGAELLIVKDGRAVFHEAYGWSDRERRIPVERNSIWSIKSMSKPFTATAVLMLAEERKLSLDDPVSRYLPGFAGDPRTTIRHLLAQTSGYTGTSRLGSPEYDYRTLRGAIEDWAQDAPTRPFGEFSYSDFNYGALGYIVEVVSGISIDDFTEEEIIRPLGLDDTSTSFSADPASGARLNPWYYWDRESGRYEVRWSNARQPWPYYPAAWGLFSTAMDYAEFLTMWIDKGRYNGVSLLSEATVEGALRPHGFTDARGVYGYGWFVDGTTGADSLPPLFSHGGGDGTLALAYPYDDAMVIFLTHSRGGAHRDLLQNRLGILGIFDHPGPHMVRADASDVRAVVLSREERVGYIGTYGSWRGGRKDGDPEAVHRVWEEGGRLHVSMGNNASKAGFMFHLVPLGDSRFALGRYGGDDLEALDPTTIIRFVVEADAVSGFDLLEDDRVLFSAQRTDFVLTAPDLQAQGEDAPLAFTNVTVIDGTSAPAQPAMTVIVAGDRIWGLGRTDSLAVPDRATVIDATAKYMIPGLWDMHAHLDDALWGEGYSTTEEKETFLALLVANGVTGVRIPGDFIEQVSAWRHRIMVGDLVGPRIVAADRPLEGGDLPFPGWVRVEREAEARAAVRSQVRRGADFIKVYDGLTRQVFFAIAAEAQRLGVDFVGHPPYVVSAAEAAAAGQKSIEHLTGTTYHCTERADEFHAEIQQAVAERGRSLTNDPVHGVYLGWDPRIATSFDPGRCRDMLAAFVEHGTWHVPTLTVFAGIRGWVERDSSPATAPDPRERYLPASVLAYWRDNFDIPASALPMFEAGAATAFRMTRTLHEAGVGLLAGTDFATVPYTFPGFSLHDEIAHLVEAGLTPMEALQTATLNPALYLGRAHSGGTIEIGKLADLVLLDADPLEEIDNTRRIRAVVLNGRYIDREALDAMLAGVEGTLQKGAGGDHRPGGR